MRGGFLGASEVTMRMAVAAPNRKRKARREIRFGGGRGWGWEVVHSVLFRCL